MSDLAWSYAVIFRQVGGEIHAYCEALPEAISAGDTEDEAALEMGRALVAAVRGRIKDGTELPAPESGHMSIALPVDMAQAAAAYVKRTV